MQWLLYDAYKVDYNRDIVISRNGLIEATANGTVIVNDSNFFAKRRKNLNGISLPCGLVVKNFILFFLFYIFNIFPYFNLLKIAYPEKFTYVDDPMTNHIDTFTKAYVKLGENLREDLNMRF